MMANLPIASLINQMDAWSIRYKKNISSLLDTHDIFEKKLKFIIDYRFAEIYTKNIIKIISSQIQLRKTIESLPKKKFMKIYLNI